MDAGGRGVEAQKALVAIKKAGVAIKKEADVVQEDMVQSGVEQVITKLIPIPLRKMTKSEYIGNG